MSETIRVRSHTVFAAQGARPVQEDHALVSRAKGVFVVADGFGGSIAGVAAAKAACEGVRNFLEKEAGDLEATLPFVLRSYFSLAGNVLFNALVHANRKALALNRGKSVHERGGASVLAGFLDGDLLALANVGLCTAWLYREEGKTELVTPRSYARLARPFDSNAGQEYRVPLTAVGISEDLEPEIFEYRICPGDWLTLETDGIPPEVRERLCAIKQEKLNFVEAATEVESYLKGLRFSDNATILLVIF